MPCVLLHTIDFHNLSIAQFSTHGHPLYSTAEHGLCAGCFEEKELFAEFYECPDCNIFSHKECIESATEKSDKKCSMCRKELMLLVHCCQSCNFKFSMSCAKNKPLSEIYKPKLHEHTLHLLLKNVSFICDACGLEGDQSPFICVTCDFMFHVGCVYFPHDPHRINAYKDIGEVRAVDDSIKVVKVDKKGKSIAHFTNEHHLLLHKDGKVDDINTRYDPRKFKQILQYYSKPIEPDHLFECLPSNLRPSSNGEGSGRKSHDPHEKNLENIIVTVPTIIPSRVLPLLRDLAQEMVRAGHQQQLLNTYRDTRGEVLEQSLKKLGVEKINKDDVNKMKGKVLQAKTVKWIHYMQISMKLLFAAEKKTYDKIFDGVESMKDQSFADFTGNRFAMLLSFGYAIAQSKRSPEKLFDLLDMYEIMRELELEFELIFGSKPCIEMKESSLYLRKIIAQTVQETFADFEEAIEKDATKKAVSDGSVHPLTSYVVNYVMYLFNYPSTLKLVFQECYINDPHIELISVVTRILQALQNNLNGKSKQYKDAALTQLFLMNNVHYIVRSVKRSKENNCLGDEWIQKHRRIIQRHATQYKRVSWTKILQCIDQIDDPSITTTVVKEKFKSFNSQFEELHRRQCQWTIPDIELREYLRFSLSGVILPIFRSFLKRFGPVIETCENPHEYIRFTPEDLQRKLDEFFEGSSPAHGGWAEVPKRLSTLEKDLIESWIECPRRHKKTYYCLLPFWVYW